MKKVFRVLGIVVLLILVAIGGIATYVKLALPDVGNPPEVKADMNAETIQRGEYLANNVMICMDCHSTRDWAAFSGPLKPGTLGQGGELFDQSMGFPGKYYSANITPSGIGDWTDGEIFRAITTGVRKSGKPIFPVMPHKNYGQLCEEDILAVVAYLRTLAPIDYTVPESESDFPMNFIINTIPEPAHLSPMPSKTDEVAYGKYLVTAAACAECHTPFDGKAFDEKFTLAGGRQFPLPGGIVTSANLTPDMETGIGKLTKENFVGLFSAYRDSSMRYRPVSQQDFNTIMPWTMYSGMTDEDLGAIYAYLRTLQPVKQKVERGYAKNMAVVSK